MRKKFYKNYDEYYYTKRPLHSKGHMIRYVKTALSKKDIKWLDIGCGCGHLVKDALDEKIDSYGIEISDYALKNALAEVKDRIKHGSLIDIPFDNETFDVISIFDIIEHIHPKDTEKAFEELNRVLKRGGVLILTTPNSGFVGDWIYDLTHINVRPPKYWKMMLENYRFKIKLNYIPSFLKYYFNKKILSLIPDKIAFFMEEPFRYLLGKIFSRKGRLYIFAKKMNNYKELKK